ncbi:MAG TPA: phosphoribosylformylglycinamidine synthase subunit PurS [Epsilonproteobacteria bacterium]|nr:phosphoribosylformylglycinamidine synthase subunit PurS [Campylobacterota bacterium]
MKVIVNVFLKEGVLDPQGKAAHHALDSLGFTEVNDVRIGKQIVMDIDAADETEAKTKVTEMTETLLANTVIENYTIEIA